MGKGALSGAIGGALSEVIAEQLMPNMAASFDEKLAEKKAELGRDLTHAEAKEEHEQFVEDIQSSIEFKARIGTAFAAALLKQDVHITDSAAENAIKNNWLNFVISAGMIAWSGYEAYETYKEIKARGEKYEGEALQTALLQMGKDTLTSLVGMRYADKVLKLLRNPSASGKLLSELSQRSPILARFAEKIGLGIKKVGTAAQKLNKKVENTSLGRVGAFVKEKGKKVGEALGKANAAVGNTRFGKFATEVEENVGAFLAKGEAVAHAAKKGTSKLGNKVKGAVGKSTAKAEASAAGKGSSALLENQRHIEQMMKDQLSKMPEMAEYMTPKTVQQAMKEIGIDAGKRYDLGYLRNQTLGWIAEKRGIKTLQRVGYEIIESKLPGNKGFDAIGIKRAADGTIKDIMILESKFSAKGGVKLARYEGIGGRKFSQMSDDWIRGVLDRMGRSGNAELRKLSKIVSRNESIVKRQINVLDQQGKTTWFPDKLPTSDLFK